MRRFLRASSISLLLFLFLAATDSYTRVEFDFEQPYFSEPGKIVKDHNLIRLGSTFHLFYLRGNPAVDLGHATSTDLIHWTLEYPILQVVPGTWDEAAIWAPHIIYDSSHGYYLMYYTGVNYSGSQQIGLALSVSPYNWGKIPWPVYSPDPSWAEWSDSTWCHGRDPFVFTHNDRYYMLITAKTNNNQGAIASAVSDDYFFWEDNGPIYVHNSWHVLESVQCIYRNNKFHLFFTEEQFAGISHMASDSLYSGWDISTRTLIDMGTAPEIDEFDGASIISRHAIYNGGEGAQTYTIGFDTLLWAGDQPYIHKPWPLAGDWNLIFGNAFTYQPTYGENPRVRGEPYQVGFEGNCWIGTYERYQGPFRYGSPGGYQGEGAIGLIRSKTFTIEGNSMNLLVGGGNYPNSCYVALMDVETGDTLCIETGKDTDQMDRRYWDLTPYKGREVYIEIADLSIGQFGHINCDDIRESMDIIDPGYDSSGDPKQDKTRMFTALHHEEKTALLQNSPNPFNPTTNISYSLSHKAHVKIEVFDVRGDRVRLLVDSEENEGPHHVAWDGKSDRGERLPSGVYFYRLSIDGKIADKKKMTLLK